MDIKKAMTMKYWERPVLAKNKKQFTHRWNQYIEELRLLQRTKDKKLKTEAKKNITALLHLVPKLAKTKKYNN